MTPEDIRIKMEKFDPYCNDKNQKDQNLIVKKSVGKLIWLISKYWMNFSQINFTSIMSQYKTKFFV